ncbi:triacylglycerol lipase [uncultured Corynebacterium sp.]|uniref:esterase/lipase family protein n=1 Tax=uncultured Corynebacterium sp. TaxID=159447 RepID=UPI0025D6A902|nr:triacylglycerol lipase [uncultured Corynebacterium sp.]
MAADALQELRSTIEKQLRRFWSNDAPANPRFGVKNTAPPNALREEVAEEIAEMLRKDPTKEGYFGSLSEDSRTRMAVSNEEVDSAGSNSTVDSLPLGARLKPRGIFEDDWTARPSPDRPWPIILLHGTADSKGIWQILGGELREDGWAVFAPDYGTRATGLLPESAVQVGAYIDAVLTMTGAEKVIIAGHSQGGLLARYWMRVLGGASKVRHLISIGAPNHGTTEGGIISPLMASKRNDSIMKSIIQSFFGDAGQQQIVGSGILSAVNAGGDLDEGVTYTCIATRHDAVVVPPETCFLSPSKVKDGTVRNIYVQDFDSRAVVLHHDLPVDRRVRAIVRTIVRQL